MPRTDYPFIDAHSCPEDPARPGKKLCPRCSKQGQPCCVIVSHHFIYDIPSEREWAADFPNEDDYERFARVAAIRMASTTIEILREGATSTSSKASGHGSGVVPWASCAPELEKLRALRYCRAFSDVRLAIQFRMLSAGKAGDPSPVGPCHDTLFPRPWRGLCLQFPSAEPGVFPRTNGKYCDPCATRVSYSARSASEGGTRLARHAGNNEATRADSPRVRAATIITTGSYGFNP